MIRVSQTAIDQVVRDIQAGVTSSDFWTNRYTDETEEEVREDTEQEEEAEEA